LSDGDATVLTKAEAEQRIEVLQAKMKLISEPPHTQ
jgi:hypothetical protein